MRDDLPKRLAPFRVRKGDGATLDEWGGTGAFEIPYGAIRLFAIGSDGSEWPFPPPAWEHVSVSLPGVNRSPNWDEMDFVKRLFWHDGETVLQLHVPRSRHVNFHPYCLHLWRPIDVEIPLPPASTVGPLGKQDSMGVV